MDLVTREMSRAQNHAIHAAGRSPDWTDNVIGTIDGNSQKA